MLNDDDDDDLSKNIYSNCGFEQSKETGPLIQITFDKVNDIILLKMIFRRDTVTS